MGWWLLRGASSFKVGNGQVGRVCSVGIMMEGETGVVGVVGVGVGVEGVVLWVLKVLC